MEPELINKDKAMVLKLHEALIVAFFWGLIMLVAGFVLGVLYPM